MSLDLVNDLRRRILSGDEPSIDELRAAIAHLRDLRQPKTTASEPRAKKEKAAPIDGDALLNSLFT